MNRRKVWFFIFLIVTLITIVLLVSGSSLLTLALDNDDSVPLGTFITWAGMMSLPLTVYCGILQFRKPTKRINKLLAGTLKILIVLAFFWLPLSYILAGNLSFSFTQKEAFQGGQMAMKWFWRLSYGIGIGTVVTVVVYWISLLFVKKETVT